MHAVSAVRSRRQWRRADRRLAGIDSDFHMHGPRCFAHPCAFDAIGRFRVEGEVAFHREQVGEDFAECAASFETAIAGGVVGKIERLVDIIRHRLACRRLDGLHRRLAGRDAVAADEGRRAEPRCAQHVANGGVWTRHSETDTEIIGPVAVFLPNHDERLQSIAGVVTFRPGREQDFRSAQRNHVQEVTQGRGGRREFATATRANDVDLPKTVAFAADRKLYAQECPCPPCPDLHSGYGRRDHCSCGCGHLQKQRGVKVIPSGDGGDRLLAANPERNRCSRALIRREIEFGIEQDAGLEDVAERGREELFECQSTTGAEIQSAVRRRQRREQPAIKVRARCRVR